jgi:enolase
MDAIERAGHTGKIVLGMDVAASEFWVPEKNVYDLDFKTDGAAKDASAILSGEELLKLYEGYV